MNLFSDVCAQASIDFPAALAERFRPTQIADFVGLDKPKKICSALAARPFESGWRGPSGTGKTSMALAVARAIPAEIHHIPSQECNLARLQAVCASCQYVPMAGYRFHLILIDEADQMSDSAQLYCLSKLDGTAQIPRTIWIFTANQTDRLQDRFLSRTKPVEFSSYGISKDATDLLAEIWRQEAPAAAPAPNFARIVKDACNNVREALQVLEIEIMLAGGAV
jgi:replication-associated recombination protein RarA